MPEKELIVSRTSYKRTIKARPVTFTCVCHPGGPIEITEERFPGPLPKACLSCHENNNYRTWRSRQDWEIRKAKAKAAK